MKSPYERIEENEILKTAHEDISEDHEDSSEGSSAINSKPYDNKSSDEDDEIFTSGTIQSSNLRYKTQPGSFDERESEENHNTFGEEDPVSDSLARRLILCCFNPEKEVKFAGSIEHYLGVPGSRYNPPTDFPKRKSKVRPVNRSNPEYAPEYSKEQHAGWLTQKALLVSLLIFNMLYLSKAVTTHTSLTNEEETAIFIPLLALVMLPLTKLLHMPSRITESIYRLKATNPEKKLLIQEESPADHDESLDSGNLKVTDMKKFETRHQVALGIKLFVPPIASVTIPLGLSSRFPKIVELFSLGLGPNYFFANLNRLAYGVSFILQAILNWRAGQLSKGAVIAGLVCNATLNELFSWSGTKTPQIAAALDIEPALVAPITVATLFVIYAALELTNVEAKITNRINGKRLGSVRFMPEPETQEAPKNEEVDPQPEDESLEISNGLNL